MVLSAISRRCVGFLLSCPKTNFHHKKIYTVPLNWKDRHGKFKLRRKFPTDWNPGVLGLQIAHPNGLLTIPIGSSHNMIWVPHMRHDFLPVPYIKFLYLWIIRQELFSITFIFKILLHRFCFIQALRHVDSQGMIEALPLVGWNTVPRFWLIFDLVVDILIQWSHVLDRACDSESTQ